MGAHPWFYSVPYAEDVAGAFAALREREFRAGRYNPVEDFPRFPVDVNHAPGCQHDSLDDAREDAAEDGTRSIIDIMELGSEPDFGIACPLAPDELQELFGTKTPSAEDILDCDDLYDRIERGQGVYVTAYQGGKPDQLIFIGYSYD
jgi:hypothetical protein